VYAVCGNDEGTLYSYVSSDDGHTFKRYVIGKYNKDDGTQSWPTMEVATDGSLWAICVDGQKVDADGTPPPTR
jgi:hypothetical protein